MPVSEDSVYDHTQQSDIITMTIMVILIVIITVSFLSIDIVPGYEGNIIFGWSTLEVFLIWMLPIFRKMRVEVAHRQISVTLGTGWPKRVIPVKDIGISEYLSANPMFFKIIRS